MHTALIYGMDISEQQISDFLKRLGLSTSNKGYYYIKHTLLLAVKESDDYLFNMTTLLYPRIAKDFKTTASSVERSIRYVIGLTFESRMLTEDINLIFNNSYSYEKGKPTNLQFLTTIAEFMKFNF